MANKVIQMILAGAGAVAALVLFSGAQLGDPATHAASGPSASGARIVTVDDNGDENFVNDNGQTSGDIFQQNAQDQSTASGAGT
jgi:hypothetical protein